MSKAALKEKATSLRLKGQSIKMIAGLLGIAPSTASLWVRNLKLSETAKKKIELLQENGRKKSAETNRSKRLAREKRVIDNCKVFENEGVVDKDTAKKYLAFLYWGEGAKTGSCVVLMNSDPDLIEAFAKLMRKAFNVDENKIRGVLHLHSYHNKKDLIAFWSKCSQVKKDKISIYCKKESGITKKEGYKGCFSFRYGDKSTFQEIMLIIERFKKVV